MKKYEAYLIDLDGTMYRGSERIEDAVHFIEALNKKKIPHLFVTNNSSRRPEQIAEKLNGMDIPAENKQVYTSSMAAAQYISEEQPEATVYAIGEEGLFYELDQAGLKLTEKKADYVVIGIDRDISYEKLTKACLNVRDGARFLSTNADVAIPTERGMVPGNGAITSVITISTGIAPVFVGKPEAVIMEQAIKTLGYPKEKVLMVGDNYHTDILAGMDAGLDTLMVFTGVTSKEDLNGYDRKPTYTTATLLDWIKYI
ncbi:TIGR01457 family HAD-type hydrolase [Thalassobacillus pellis]|uniref:TIGR01457 family HAD-type hydrolase n=1 Tax=Thalassobacillus pellis TaxID=748008 RepID=UPI0019616697|nr:TIGR01457 family HAD-type hydrolase [Thalassobacillus pellis]MBM7554882.1 4-nitrophenyl phosphatase [Thalassobacillus pellis]